MHKHDSSVSKLGLLALFLALGVSMFGCASDDSEEGDGAGKKDTSAMCPVVVSDEDCDETQRPIVFVHGTYGSGDNIANVALLFGSNGYCQDRFVAVEYNSLGGNPQAQLDALIDSILEKTGQTQVDLMGHSQGTGHCVTYLKDAAHAAKVAHYVNLSGEGEVPNDVKTLSISSMNDLSGKPHHAPNAEKQVTFDDADHFTLAASAESFAAIYKYLIGKDPKYMEVQCGDEQVTIEGLAEQFGDNTPVTDGKIEVYELGDDATERGKPVATIVAGEGGKAAPIKLDRLTAYEFKALDGAGKLVGYQYFAPFKRSNRLVRFLAPPQNPLVKATTTDRVKIDAGHSVFVMRSLAGAFRHDLGQTLEIDGSDVLTDDNAGKTTTTVGLFMADQNLDKMSNLGETFSAPFIEGTDVYMDASKVHYVDLKWNGSKMKIPSWPSDKSLISITVQ